TSKQVGDGAPTKRISLRNSTSKASWGWGPNKENFTEKFNKQSKLGMGPNKENFTVNSTFLAPLFD
ncbi:hypothetical protein K4S05_10360, partial [Staphylococcus epidermidis]|nr:hypothetical protein [Staphylococcus epidermidis]